MNVAHAQQIMYIKIVSHKFEHYIHSREIETLNFFNGKYMGVLLKVLDRGNESWSFQGMLFEMITTGNEKEVHPSKDNICISLR